jgi:hypothetical protein
MLVLCCLCLLLMFCYFNSGRAGDLGSGADNSREEDDYFSNISFFSFSLQGLFCASRFTICKHVFEKLNPRFSIALLQALLEMLEPQ